MEAPSAKMWPHDTFAACGFMGLCGQLINFSDPRSFSCSCQSADLFLCPVDLEANHIGAQSFVSKCTILQTRNTLPVLIVLSRLRLSGFRRLSTDFVLAYVSCI